MRIGDYIFREKQEYASMMQFHTKKEAAAYIRANLGSLYSPVKVEYHLFATWHIIKRLTNKMIRNDGAECEFCLNPYRVVLRDHYGREKIQECFDRVAAETLLSKHLGPSLESRSALAFLYRAVEIYDDRQALVVGMNLSCYVGC